MRGGILNPFGPGQLLMSTNKIIPLPEPRLESAGPDLWRLVATVEGKDFFIESSLPLSPRSESVVCPFLFPAMLRHADLEVAGSLDPTFQKNLAFVRKRAVEWWPQLGVGEVHSPLGTAAPRGSHSGVFYTGGIDSSYALQQLHSRLRYAVFVEGFDIPLGDSARLEKARRRLIATTEACGVELLVVRTNLREHPFFAAVNWEITHVAALAAIAHALGQHVHTMYVAASDVPPPWGSAPDLDAAWSSESISIENFSAELTRLQRVRSLARWEPLRGHLRVCWENNSSALNCGFCEKCVRTRMQLYVSGAPDGLDSFPAGLPLSSVIRRLYSVQHDLHGQWREICANLNDHRLRRLIERALQRQKPQIWRRAMGRFKRAAALTIRKVTTRWPLSKWTPPRLHSDKW